MPYNLKKLVVEKVKYYEADPDVFFPKTIDRIKEVKADGVLPEEIYGGNQNAMNQFLRQIEGFTTEDLDLETGRRADVLAFAESYFQRAILLGLGKKRFRILNKPAWKRKE